MSKTKQVILFLFIFAVLLSVSFLLTFRSMDPDFGWHLKTGQLILQRGIPYHDWYSYTMPNFSWIDHEWLTEVLLYKGYSLLGGNIILLIFLIIYTLSFFVTKKSSQSFVDVLLPVTLGYLATVNFLGIRTAAYYSLICGYNLEDYYRFFGRFF